MTISRRDFVKGTTAAAAVSFVLPGQGRPTSVALPQADANIRELCMVALDAAKSAGASYADVRVSRNRNQNVSARNRRIQSVRDTETLGFGVRVLVDGAWGFAASRELQNQEAIRIARMATDQARANRRITKRPVELASAPSVPDGRWQSPIEVDPFTISIEDKVDLLLRANEVALGVQGVRFVTSALFFLREEKTFASTDGSFTVQTIYRTYPRIRVTAVASDFSDFQSRNSAEIAPMGLGYEHVLQSDLAGQASMWAEEAVAMLSAKSVDVGRYDLVLDPHHLFLTIHESIAHPTELDRVMGYEANYAGTSFVSPPEKMIGQLQYGPEFMNIVGDRSQPGSLSAVGWDDEGVQPDEFHLVRDGIFVDYQTTRDQVAWISELTGVNHSHGCSYASSWSNVQFQRMPNVSLMPGEEDLSADDLIAATDNGIYIIGRGSYSIDQQRYNFQFGGQAFYEIKDGKITGMLKDVAYQGRTPEFWNSMDMIGGQSSYRLNGSFGDAKGQPSQSNAVSHGSPPARFRNVNVINPGRSG